MGDEMTNVKELYRYQESKMWETSVLLRRFPVIKETPCGYWIISVQKRRWVSKCGISAWAKPTPAAALESFKARKMRQIAILEKQLQHARDVYNIAVYDEGMGRGGHSACYEGSDLLALERRRREDRVFDRQGQGDAV